MKKQSKPTNIKPKSTERLMASVAGRSNMNMYLPLIRGSLPGGGQSLLGMIMQPRP